MILLTDTNDTLEIALTESPTVQPSVVVAYVDHTTSGTTGPSNIASIYGYIQPSSNGTVIARFASEVTSSAIVAKAGSIVRYMRSV